MLTSFFESPCRSYSVRPVAVGPPSKSGTARELVHGRHHLWRRCHHRNWPSWCPHWLCKVLREWCFPVGPCRGSRCRLRCERGRGQPNGRRVWGPVIHGHDATVAESAMPGDARMWPRKLQQSWSVFWHGFIQLFWHRSQCHSWRW